MGISGRSVGRVEVMALSGTLDAAASPEVRTKLEALVEAGRKRLVVDLSGVRFVDSSGFFALVSSYKAARAAGGDVVLLGLPPPVRSVIELTRLHRVFEIFEDEAAAVGKLSA
jgi:anti-sigma B factor antagonist